MTPSTSTFPYRDNARYHLHNARDPQARAEHAAVSRAWRRDLAAIAFHDRDIQVLLAAVRDGMTVAQAAAAIRVSYQQVYGRARWDTDFREALEDALAQACPAGRYCGTPTGARYHGGRCRACRTAKRQPRTTNSPERRRGRRPH